MNIILISYKTIFYYHFVSVFFPSFCFLEKGGVGVAVRQISWYVYSTLAYKRDVQIWNTNSIVDGHYSANA